MKKILFILLAIFTVLTFSTCKITIGVEIDPLKGTIDIENNATSNTTITSFSVASILSPNNWGENLLTSSVIKGGKTTINNVTLGTYWAKLRLETGSVTQDYIVYIGLLKAGTTKIIEVVGDWSVEKAKIKVVNGLKDGAIYSISISTNGTTFTPLTAAGELYILPGDSSAETTAGDTGNYYVRVGLSATDSTLYATSNSTFSLTAGSTTTVTVNETNFTIPKGTVKITNNFTSADIVGVYVVPSAYTTYSSSSLISSTILRNGGSLDVSVTPGVYKIRVDTGGSTYWVYNDTVSVTKDQTTNVAVNQTNWTFAN